MKESNLVWKNTNKNVKYEEKEPVPEIHDIGKLINKEATEIEHNFENYPGKLQGLPEIKENATWKGIREHHCQLPAKKQEKVLKEYPKSKETVILAIADSLASVVSRHIKIGGHPFYNVYKLWNPTQNITRLSNAIRAHSMGKEWIEKIVNFVNKNPSKEEYFQEFGAYLEKRCEDASPGCNITSLLTHSILVGKFYRVLKKIEIPLQIDFRNAKKEEICDLVNKKLPSLIKLTIIKCKIKLPQYIHRTRDLNIFKIREELLRKFQEKYPEVFFRTSDEMIIFSKDDSILDEIKNKIKKYGLIIEITKATPTLKKGDFKNNFIKVLFGRGKKEVLYSKDPEDEIPSNIGICEVCQLSPVKSYDILSDDEKKLLVDEKGRTDNLCESCIEIRKYGESLSLLSKWEEGNVAWIKITLDFMKLVEKLKMLYKEYITGLGEKDVERYIEIRPSLISEFQLDYNKFLNQFNEKIHQNFDGEEKRVQDVLEDLFCIKINKLSEIVKILEIYNELIGEFFPKFRETSQFSNSPLRFVISCSNVKFPFFEHWRHLENPKYDVEVILIGKGKIELELNKLSKLLDLKLKEKTALEKLGKISEISEQLAWMQIFSEKEVKFYPELQEALREGFKLSSLLTYIKIISD